MKIAVTSQNRKNITDHAGRCRKFWIFHIENDAVVDKQLLELPREQSFHDSSPHDDHPLDDVDVLISGGMGQGLMKRLARKNIQCLITSEDDPASAVSLFIEGKLAGDRPRAHSHGTDEAQGRLAPDRNS
jgi:predicted Fe-Mo cluster-binding NifX family protein